MIVSFADNLVMVCDTSTSVITTDPVAMDGNDRLAGVLNVHYIFGTNGLLSIQLQGSNDGTTWIDLGAPETEGAAEASGIGQVTAAYAFVRYEFTFSAADVGGICFDLHSRLDHA